MALFMRTGVGMLIAALGVSSLTAMLETRMFRRCYPWERLVRFQLNSASTSRETARARRKARIGLAKAVDRGLPEVKTYDPFKDGAFKALSGLPDRTRPFLVLGIESSCDDTGAAILSSDGKILGEALAKQNEIHQEWGGVVPGLARDAHVSNIDRVVNAAVSKAKLKSVDEVDAIAVTVGPGLEICLRVGCEKAYELAQAHRKPFVAIHHLEAHILMARLPSQEGDSQNIQQPVDFPFLALLLSGGHCQILECRGIGQYRILGGTLDDSLGEAYDKTARLLGLPVGGGGGPAIENLARSGNPKAVPFSVPMQSRKDVNFSYSGLKSSVRRMSQKLVEERGLQNIEDLDENDRANIAASFQHIAIKHVEQRMKRAMEMVEAQGIRTIAVVGGVAANQELRSRIQSICNDREWRMVVPPPRLCTDQGAMSAWAGVERLKVGSSDQLATDVYARYPFAQIKDDQSSP